MLFKMHLRPKIKSASVQIQLRKFYLLDRITCFDIFQVVILYISVQCDTILHKNPTNAPTYVKATLFTLNTPTCFSPQEAIFREY